MREPGREGGGGREGEREEVSHPGGRDGGRERERERGSGRGGREGGRERGRGREGGRVRVLLGR